MYNFLVKNGQLLAFGLGAIITIVFLVSASGVPEGFMDMAREDQYKASNFDFGITMAVALIVVAMAALVLFGLFQVVTDIRGSLKGIIGFAVLIGIFFISSTLSSGEVTPEIATAVAKFKEANNQDISAATLKNIGGGITTTLVLIVTAVGAFILFEVLNFFK